MLTFGGIAQRSPTTSEADLPLLRDVERVHFCQLDTVLHCQHALWMASQGSDQGNGTVAHRDVVLELHAVMSPEHLERILNTLESFGPNLAAVIFHSQFHGWNALSAAVPHRPALAKVRTHLVHYAPAWRWQLTPFSFHSATAAVLSGVVDRLAFVDPTFPEAAHVDPAGADVLARLADKPRLWQHLPFAASAIPLVPLERCGAAVSEKGNSTRLVVTIVANFHQDDGATSLLLALCASLTNLDVIHAASFTQSEMLQNCRTKMVLHDFPTSSSIVQEDTSVDPLLRPLLAESSIAVVSSPVVASLAIASGIPCLLPERLARKLYASDKQLLQELSLGEDMWPSAGGNVNATIKADKFAARLRALPKLRPNVERLSRSLAQETPKAYSSLLSAENRSFLYRLPSNLTLTGPPTSPPVFSAVAKVPPVERCTLTGLHVFAASELGSSSSSGAGQVISELVRSLIVRCDKLRVHVVAHTESMKLDAWRAAMNAALPPDAYARLFISNVRVTATHATVTASDSSHVLRSRQFAAAIGNVNKETPIDVVELFDFAGVGYELLRHRAAYLDPRTRIIVRAHGTYELAQHTEQAALVPGYSDQLVHLMERYVLQCAHAVRVPSPAIARLYQCVYHISSERLLVSPPPMAPIVEHLEAEQAPLTHGQDLDRIPTLLVYGPLALVKGLETVVHAAVSLMEEEVEDEPWREKMRIKFIGAESSGPYDAPQPVKEHLLAIIPDELAGRFVFVHEIGRGELTQRLSNVHAAIVASSFETFGLVPHELASLKTPLIISDIPAFREHFSEENAFIFAAQDAQSLAEAIRRSFSSPDKLSKLRSLPPLKYQDSVYTYANKTLWDTARGTSDCSASAAAPLLQRLDQLLMAVG